MNLLRSSIIVFLFFIIIIPATAAPLIGIAGITDDQFGTARGVTVSLNTNNTTITDYGGEFSFTLAPGTYNVTFSKKTPIFDLPEYQTLVITNVIVNYSYPYYTIRTPILTKIPYIGGRVTGYCSPYNESMCNLSGVAIFAGSDKNYSNANGEYILNISNETYNNSMFCTALDNTCNVTYSKMPEYYTNISYSIPTGMYCIGRELELKPTGTITGRVCGILGCGDVFVILSKFVRWFF